MNVPPITRPYNAFSKRYDSLTQNERCDLIETDPECAIKMINVFGDKDMAQAYVRIHPSTPSAYHIAQKFNLRLEGNPMLRKNTTTLTEIASASLPKTIKEMAEMAEKNKRIREHVASVNSLGYVSGAGVPHTVEEETNPLWENIVRIYEDDDR